MFCIMPNIFSNSLNMSLLSGLFVFIAFCGFTIYFVILCFALCNTQVIRWYSNGITYCFQKQPSVSLKYLKSACKIPHIPVSWKQLFECLINHLKSPLYFLKHSKKYLKYCLKVLKSSLYKLIRIQKPSKAVGIYSTRELYLIFKLRYRSFFNPNPTL